jgi:CubicO group peptidase (beta-lactamase class C family)
MLRCWAAIVVLVALGPRVLAAPAIPDTPAGRAFSEWLSAFNAADAQRIGAFQQKYERKGRVEDLLQFRDYTGGFELLRVDESAPERLLALLRENASGRGTHFELTIQGDGRGDNLIMQIRPAMLPPEFAPPRLSMKDAVAALRDRAAEQTKADRFAGALLMAQGDRILVQQAWGLANRESSMPATLDTQFRLGSMNKMFTAVAVLQLVEAGKLSLTGTVGQYLRDYPNRDVATKVTVRHLLTHSGGTGDIFGPEFDAHRLELQEHRDYVALFGKRAPEFEPGSRDSYSNYGYVLLGALIEAVSGTSYYDYVQKHIYEKAGMHATASLPESVVVPNRSAGYMREGDKWLPNTNTLPYRGMAAGGGYSTVGDLVRFARALEGGKLISKQMLEQATTSQNVGGGYGYGFGIQGEGAMRFYGHGGGAPGMNGDLRIYPASGYVLVGLSNLDPPTAENMVEYFAQRMPLAEASAEKH